VISNCGGRLAKAGSLRGNPMPIRAARYCSSVSSYAPRSRYRPLARHLSGALSAAVLLGASEGLSSCAPICTNDTALVRVADLEFLISRAAGWSALMPKGNGHFPCWRERAPPVSVGAIYGATVPQYKGSSLSIIDIFAVIPNYDIDKMEKSIVGPELKTIGNAHIYCGHLHNIRMCSLFIRRSASVGARSRFTDEILPENKWAEYIHNVSDSIQSVRRTGPTL
jgi:hypothetical protein